MNSIQSSPPAEENIHADAEQRLRSSSEEVRCILNAWFAGEPAKKERLDELQVIIADCRRTLSLVSK